MSVDFKELNRITRKNVYHLPLPEDLQQAVGNADWFNGLDCYHAFWQFLSRKKTSLKRLSA